MMLSGKTFQSLSGSIRAEMLYCISSSSWYRGIARFSGRMPEQLVADNVLVAVEIQQLGAGCGDVEEDRPARTANVQIVEFVERNQQLLIVDLIEYHGSASPGVE